MHLDANPTKVGGQMVHKVGGQMVHKVGGQMVYPEIFT